MTIALNLISLLGGLAMFLYGMRLMGDNLKEGSSDTLRAVIEKVTNNPIKAFFLGLLVTAIIQSSTATIVITSGLVAAGIISLDQSLGIIIGANVGTTVTGQIIRLLDVNAESGSVLQFFQPSTLAPIALIIGMVLIMGFKFQKADSVGNIAIGFGILFSGLLNMTGAVSSFTSSGITDRLFANLGNNPLIAYLTGAGIAFVLQSSSASIGILQAFSMAGDIPFKTVFVILTGIYLGDCVTTAIVCSIGAKPDSRRVGIINILFNLCKTLLIIVVVTVIHRCGLLTELWDASMRSGDIANANSVFNLGCAALLLPAVGLFKKFSYVIVKDEPGKEDKYAELINSLSPVFFSTPALAFRSCFDVLSKMFDLAYDSIFKALGLINEFDEKVYKEILESEEDNDRLTDRVDNYLVQLSPHVSEDNFIRILTQYHKLASEFEHLGDYAVYIANAAKSKNEEKVEFSEEALKELNLSKMLLDSILQYTKTSFEKRDVDSAYHIEPLEEVMNDMVNALHDNHLARLREGSCSIRAGVLLMEVLSNVENISDTCSNIGVATIVRAHPERANNAHTYVSSMHKGNDTLFNREYDKTHELYFTQLDALEYGAIVEADK